MSMAERFEDIKEEEKKQETEQNEEIQNDQDDEKDDIDIYDYVDEKYREGKTIVIIGEKSHPEVVGLNGWCDNSAYIFSSEDEDFSVLPDNDCCVVVQTTYSKEKFEKIIKKLDNTV